MERLKPYLLGGVLFGPPLVVIMILDTPEAAGARAGLLIAAATIGFWFLASIMFDSIRKGGQ